MQSFELFRLYGEIYSPALQLKSLIHEKPQNSVIAASPRRIVALSIWRCATVRVRARIDQCDIVLSSRLTVGNFIFPFIQMAEARESSYIRPVKTVTPAVSLRVISDFGGIDDNWDTVKPQVHSSRVRFSCSDGNKARVFNCDDNARAFNCYLAICPDRPPPCKSLKFLRRRHTREFATLRRKERMTIFRTTVPVGAYFDFFYDSLKRPKSKLRCRDIYHVLLTIKPGE